MKKQIRTLQIDLEDSNKINIHSILNNPEDADGDDLDQTDRSGSTLDFVTPHKFLDEKNDSGLLKDTRWHIVHRI
jgi:hypothetical protein